MVGAVTGTRQGSTTVLLGRYDPTGRLRCVGRTTALRPETARAWPGGWHRRGVRTRGKARRSPGGAAATRPTSADLARVGAGHWRHPVRTHRLRTDLGTGDVPLMGEPDLGTPPR
ncbi:hypothetical protein AB0953_31985 [Streptomyces sp. NPDC046866]|uniref:hypothetical protein n=1 Tax=Streptomyces sp. NPDC046866 TaxID=3154921 RepID=UPI003456C751